MTSFVEYEKMRDAGESPLGVLRKARLDGLDKITCVRLIREVFGLDLAQAKDVLLRSDGGRGIIEHQQELLDAVSEALDREDRRK
jgi:hypothetical protein